MLAGRRFRRRLVSRPAFQRLYGGRRRMSTPSRIFEDGDPRPRHKALGSPNATSRGHQAEADTPVDIALGNGSLVWRSPAQCPKNRIRRGTNIPDRLVHPMPVDQVVFGILAGCKTAKAGHQRSPATWLSGSTPRANDQDEP